MKLISAKVGTFKETLDITFGVNGKLTTDFTGTDGASGVLVQGDSNIEGGGKLLAYDPSPQAASPTLNHMIVASDMIA